MLFEVGNFAARGPQNVDPRLVAILRGAAAGSPYRVEAFSGYRPGDRRFHGRGLATDVRLIGDQGPLANYQSGRTFRQYEQFAQAARRIQMERYPELNNMFRWGGYFSGPRGKYGALDTMHFDIGGAGMGGGSWAGGLTARQRQYFPEAESIGMGAQPGVTSSQPAQRGDLFANLGLGLVPGAGAFRRPYDDINVAPPPMTPERFMMGMIGGENPLRKMILGGLGRMIGIS